MVPAAAPAVAIEVAGESLNSAKYSGSKVQVLQRRHVLDDTHVWQPLPQLPQAQGLCS